MKPENLNTKEVSKWSLKNIAAYAGYAVGIITAVIFFAKLFISVNAMIVAANKIDNVYTVMDSMNTKIDAVDEKVDVLIQAKEAQDSRINKVEQRENAFELNYNNHLLNDKTLTTKQFYDFMAGAGFGSDEKKNSIIASRQNETHL